MGMLMHNTLMEMEKAESKQRIEPKAEKPVEVPVKESEPVKKTGGRRKTSK